MISTFFYTFIHSNFNIFYGRMLLDVMTPNRMLLDVMTPNGMLLDVMTPNSVVRCYDPF